MIFVIRFEGQVSVEVGIARLTFQPKLHTERNGSTTKFPFDYIFSLLILGRFLFCFGSQESTFLLVCFCFSCQLARAC